MKILITGNAGFIGSHLSLRLLNEGHTVIGIDNFNSDIYDASFKEEYIEPLKPFTNTFVQHRTDILDYTEFGDPDIDVIIHLAGYANVRMSFIEPDKFVRNNLETTTYILHHMSPKTRFIYASSSSVYGENKKIPFEESDELANIVSPYALTKKMCEDMVGLYCQTKQISAIGFRFFTVYGRPDMAVYQFMERIRNGEPITIFGYGDMVRDFTHVDDIVDGVYNSLFIDVSPGEHKLYNLGNNNPISLNQLISHIEVVLNKTAIVQYITVPRGEVPITYANIDKAKRELGFSPKIDIEKGLRMLL
jgi:UDP-glucuronate 4-epimerase